MFRQHFMAIFLRKTPPCRWSQKVFETRRRFSPYVIDSHIFYALVGFILKLAYRCMVMKYIKLIYLVRNQLFVVTSVVCFENMCCSRQLILKRRVTFFSQ